MSSDYDLTAGRADGPDVALRHRRGGVGAGPPAHDVPPEEGWDVAARTVAELPRDRARRGRGIDSAAVARPVGGLPARRAGARAASPRTRPPTPVGWPSASACSCGPSRRRTAGRPRSSTPTRAAPASGCGSRAWARWPGLPSSTRASRIWARRWRNGSPAAPACWRPGRSAGGPEEEAGAWFREDVTRMDDQQHSLSALLAAVGLIERSR